MDGNKRYYLTPEGNRYPSVTTWLGSFPNPSLEAWKQRMGPDSEIIAQAARDRGTTIHSMAEAYLRNQPMLEESVPLRYAFAQIQASLQTNIGDIYALEQPVYSDKLRLGGQLDCFCNWNGVPSVVDFKTSRYAKAKEHILHYFLQGTAYAIMLHERVGLLPKQVVIIMIPSDDAPVIYVEKVVDYIGELITKIKETKCATL